MRLIVGVEVVVWKRFEVLLSENFTRTSFSPREIADDEASEELEMEIDDGARIADYLIEEDDWDRTNSKNPASLAWDEFAGNYLRLMSQ